MTYLIYVEYSTKDNIAIWSSSHMRMINLQKLSSAKEQTKKKQRTN